MKDIKEIRGKITQLDAEGIKYLEKRLELANEVALYKASTGLPVFDQKRENEVVADFKQKFELKRQNGIASVISGIMRISREKQYEILISSDSDWQLGKTIINATKNEIIPKSICCQGISGSYSHIAASYMYPELEIIPTNTWDECVDKLSEGICDLSFLPLENTTAGTVDDVYDLLFDRDVYIVKSITIPVRHKLIMKQGSVIEDIKTVISHPQAIAQCSNFIKRNKMNIMETGNTAFAVEKVFSSDDFTLAAIASEYAARRFDLVISEMEICNHTHNQTRFVVLSPTPVITQNVNRMSLSFCTTHQSGSLNSVLSMFSDRGLNLTKIQSRPVPERPWEYSFWVDVSATYGDDNVLLLLYQLSKELPFVKFHGWYEETEGTI